MAFKIDTRSSTAGDTGDTVYRLSDGLGAAIEVWPAFGFNCLTWETAAGHWLYADSAWEQNPIPTRSGHPILFPFPNRMERGLFAFHGKTYQLSLNDSTGQHAIHGFTPKRPWRVVGSTAESDHATITGQLRLGLDAPDLLAYWPGDLQITVTYRLSSTALDVTGYVENLSTEPVPFGLGYHPYFTLPTSAGSTVDGWKLQVRAAKLWPLEAGIPTGECTAVPTEYDYSTLKPVGTVALDTLYTGLPLSPAQQPRRVATLSDDRSTLHVSATGEFRELLVFTPQHRLAVAIEPYTCASNGMNIAHSGWLQLPPLGAHASAVRYEATSG